MEGIFFFVSFSFPSFSPSFSSCHHLRTRKTGNKKKSYEQRKKKGDLTESPLGSLPLLLSTRTISYPIFFLVTTFLIDRGSRHVDAALDVCLGDRLGWLHASHS